MLNWLLQRNLCTSQFSSKPLWAKKWWLKVIKNLITIFPGSNEITFNEELCKVSIRWTESNLSRKHWQVRYIFRTLRPWWNRASWAYNWRGMARRIFSSSQSSLSSQPGLPCLWSVQLLSSTPPPPQDTSGSPRQWSGGWWRRMLTSLPTVFLALSQVVHNWSRLYMKFC